VFAGVLLAVLAAVEVTHRIATPPLPLLYAVLLGGLALAWLIPPGKLLTLDVPLRALVAVILSFIPIFAANVIFAKRFSATSNASAAFATNLLGAIVGGCLEYLSLIFGYRALLIVAAGLYITAFAITDRSKHLPSAVSATPVRATSGTSGRGRR